ncbi:response regulator transcription factor [Ureaplasma parvum]|uniref:response regulator transcription factor n=1 Tax=Ureaplasma parvum TaxID=134821 RepID=UPI0026E99210|nr:response regulator transcription factor [Ureaplasma parvum]
MNSTILIIEDDKDINEMLTKLLTNNNYNVLNAYSGTEGVLVHNDNIDLILLDLMLPGKNGEEIIRELKNKNNVPVIVMSAIQDIDKKVDLFDLGANDYITKPFHNDELLARIKVQLRDKNNTISNILKFKDVELNKVNFTVNCNNKEVAFTKKEFELLKLLMENENQTLTKSMIFDSIWNDENSADDNTLNVYISKIKNKLKECNPDEEYIETVWSIGYRLKK